MFARFRNLFSRNKTESEVETTTSLENSKVNVDTSARVIDSCEESSKLDSLNYLTSVVENEQQNQTNNNMTSDLVPPNCLGDEVAELLTKRILKIKEMPETVFFRNENENLNAEKENSAEPRSEKSEMNNDFLIKSVKDIKNEEKRNGSFEVSSEEWETNCAQLNIKGLSAHEKDYNTDPSELVHIEKEKDPTTSDNKNNTNSDSTQEDNKETIKIEKINQTNASNELLFQSQVPTDAQELDSRPVDPPNIESNIKNSCENFSKLSDSSKSLSQSTIKENHAISTTPSSLPNLENNPCNNSSIVVEDLPPEITTPSSTIESTISGSSSNISTLESSSISKVLDVSKIIVNPIDNNALACNAITNKLNDIAEVAESLDAVIRDVQENVQCVEVEANPSASHKKFGTTRSTSSEDWHSRSTEDDSFATASEGNFTPSSSSFQTASGRTSSYISCDKNSFDASEADDSTYPFEMPELTSPLNMSFEGSEQSYLSAQPLNSELITQGKQKIPSHKLTESVSKPVYRLEEDQNTTADIEELHSENVTPTPEENYDGSHVESITIQSENELEIAGIADAPSLEILTEHKTLPMSRTPEVSPTTSNVCSNQNPITTQLTINMATDSNDQQDPHNAASTNNSNNNKPNAAWRRSKYYENITKQTIKGFL